MPQIFRGKFTRAELDKIWAQIRKAHLKIVCDHADHVFRIRFFIHPFTTILEIQSVRSINVQMRYYNRKGGVALLHGTQILFI